MEGKRVRWAPAALVLLALSGCVSPEELRAHDVATCGSYGFKPETPDFAQCLQRENLARQYYWASPYYYGPFYGPFGPYPGMRF
jgi:hypothetical protein